MWQHLLPFFDSPSRGGCEISGGDCKLNDWEIDLFILMTHFACWRSSESEILVLEIFSEGKGSGLTWVRSFYSLGGSDGKRGNFNHNFMAFAFLNSTFRLIPFGYPQIERRYSRGEIYFPIKTTQLEVVTSPCRDPNDSHFLNNLAIWLIVSLSVKAFRMWNKYSVLCNLIRFQWKSH